MKVEREQSARGWAEVADDFVGVRQHMLNVTLNFYPGCACCCFCGCRGCGLADTHTCRCRLCCEYRRGVRCHLLCVCRCSATLLGLIGFGLVWFGLLSKTGDAPAGKENGQGQTPDAKGPLQNTQCVERNVSSVKSRSICHTHMCAYDGTSSSDIQHKINQPWNVFPRTREAAKLAGCVVQNKRSCTTPTEISLVTGLQYRQNPPDFHLLKGTQTKARPRARAHQNKGERVRTSS